MKIGKSISAFNFEDEGTRNFWRHMIRDLVVDLGTNEAGIPVDISQFAEAGTFSRKEFEKRLENGLKRMLEALDQRESLVEEAVNMY